jgi:hypothetical protein
MSDGADARRVAPQDAPVNEVLATLTERARWYRDGCDGLEDIAGYFASGDCARDAARDLESALSEIRVLELVIVKFRGDARREYQDWPVKPAADWRFHWRDGYYFQRLPLGAVLVTLPDHSQKVIPPNEWASIVAHVSQAGETAESFAAALAFHGEQP